VTTLPTTSNDGYCDSLSCLHAIEHFGLRCYEGSVNSSEYQAGIAGVVKLLQLRSIFYLFTPIGQEHVIFNTN